MMTLDESIEECRGLSVDYALAAGDHAGAQALAMETPCPVSLARSVATRARYDSAHRALQAGLSRLADVPGGWYFADAIRLKSDLNATLSQRIATRRALASLASSEAA